MFKVPVAGSHSVLAAAGQAAALAGRNLWALAIKFPHADVVKLIIREVGSPDVVLYSECSTADAQHLMELAGIDLESSQLDETVRVLRSDGMNLGQAIDTALALRD